jgi:DNA gyrase subunit B
MNSLFDCREHEPDVAAELFIAEGDSAAEALCAVRNPRHQAVLPLQGKPMNALRASPARLRANPWLAALVAVLGDTPGTALPLGQLKFGRVIMVMDPDADGIHAGALLQIFFLRFMKPLLEQGRICIVHAPWAEIRVAGKLPQLSFHQQQFSQQCQQLETAGITHFERIRYRGLGTITPALLESTCVNPATRRARILRVADAEMAATMFGGIR